MVAAVVAFSAMLAIFPGAQSRGRRVPRCLRPEPVGQQISPVVLTLSPPDVGNCLTLPSCKTLLRPTTRLTAGLVASLLGALGRLGRCERADQGATSSSALPTGPRASAPARGVLALTLFALVAAGPSRSALITVFPFLPCRPGPLGSAHAGRIGPICCFWLLLLVLRRRGAGRGVQNFAGPPLVAYGHLGVGPRRWSSGSTRLGRLHRLRLPVATSAVHRLTAACAAVVVLRLVALPSSFASCRPVLYSELAARRARSKPSTTAAGGGLDSLGEMAVMLNWIAGAMGIRPGYPACPLRLLHESSCAPGGSRFRATPRHSRPAYGQRTVLPSSAAADPRPPPAGPPAFRRAVWSPPSGGCLGCLVLLGRAGWAAGSIGFGPGANCPPVK